MRANEIRPYGEKSWMLSSYSPIPVGEAVSLPCASVFGELNGAHGSETGRQGYIGFTPPGFAPLSHPPRRGGLLV